MALDLANKYRPKKLSQMVGQPTAVAVIRGWIKRGKIPSAILLSGPSGTGKTTLGRILKNHLQCPDDFGYEEINAADDKGIGMVRDILNRIQYKTLGGKPRLWFLDEIQETTKAAQNCILKVLEEPPPNTYFVLGTTETAGLLRTVRTRCKEIKLSPVDPGSITTLLQRVCAGEGVQVSKKVMAEIVELADGSPRMALSKLEEVIGLDTEQDMLEALTPEETKAESIDLCRALMRRAHWRDVAKIISKIKSDPERVRVGVLGYASSVLLSGKQSKTAHEILIAFEDPFYNTMKNGLIRSSYDVCGGK